MGQNTPTWRPTEGDVAWYVSASGEIRQVVVVDTYTYDCFLAFTDGNERPAKFTRYEYLYPNRAAAELAANFYRSLQK